MLQDSNIIMLPSIKYSFIFYFLFSIRLSDGQCPNNMYNSKQQKDVSTCMVWGSYHVKTFDDNGFSFRTECPMTLVSFTIKNSEFRIDVGKSDKNCRNDDCYTFVDILYNGDTYKLGRNAMKLPSLTTGTKSHTLPVDLPGVSVAQPGVRVILELTRIGVVIKWDEKDMIDISIENGKGYQILGVCGNNDQCSSNDQLSRTNQDLSADYDEFLDHWRASTVCKGVIDTQSPCKGKKHEIGAADKQCQILKDPRFKEANDMIDTKLYIDACISSYCLCKKKGIDCLCETLDVYAKASISAGVPKVSWRNPATCEKKCKGQVSFLPCAPKGGLQTCNGVAPVATPGAKCEEGCYCDASKYFLNGNCYIKKRCPCVSGGRILQPEETIVQNCHTCTCKNGQIDCPKTPCMGPTAGAWGDPHYTTFDGKKFDFMGKCGYYLVEGPDFSVESDQYGWAKGQWTKQASGPSYIRRIIIRVGGNVVEFKPNLAVTINDVEVTRFPLQEDSILITKPSGSFVLAVLSNHVQVQWNGVYDVLVRLPTTMEGLVTGLLGTYTEDTSDDFVTRDGELVSDAITFGNSWKTDYSCGDLPPGEFQHPCVANPAAKVPAEKFCSIIKSPIFDKCAIEEYETDYENCVYDSCYCKENIERCMCGSISTFADKCGRKQIQVNWQNERPECRPTCPPGQVYQLCNDGCSRTCEDISLRPECSKSCVEGCNCPNGQTMDEDGKCIPVSQCKCRIDGIAYPTGFRLLKSEEELLTCQDAKWVVTVPDDYDKAIIPYQEDLNARCTIKNSVFSPCKSATLKTCQNMHNYVIKSVALCEEGCECKDGYAYEPSLKSCVKRQDCPCYEKRRSYDEGAVIVQEECSRCVCTNGFWKCQEEENCDLLCKGNEVRQEDCNTCTCKDAYWECTDKECCSNEQETKKIDCNTCVCTNGAWECTDKICQKECKEDDKKQEGCKICTCEDGQWNCNIDNCSVDRCGTENAVQVREFGKCVCKNGEWKCVEGQCDIWGDSHINTFDKVRYDFQGECNYTLVMGNYQNDRFRIDVSNEICSHEGATCLKSFTINVKTDSVAETITLVKNANLPETKQLSKLILKNKSLFVTIYVIDAGIEIFWDTKTWLYVKLDGRWENQVSGLCGNFNRQKKDDLEVSGKSVGGEEGYRFAESWKINSRCEITKPNENICNSKRRAWAEKQCNVLTSKVFAPCHDTLSVDSYYEACVMDSCKCDLGGDCECLCTAIAAYAQQCNNYGVPLKWRSQTTCPIQCTGNTVYEPCMKTCPPTTCEVIQKNLAIDCEEEETCTEGCAPKPLAPGYVYTDTTYSKSVRESVCTQQKCIVDGITYDHRDIIRETDCEMCLCSSGKEACMELPTCEDKGKTTTPKGEDSKTETTTARTSKTDTTTAGTWKTGTTTAGRPGETTPIRKIYRYLPVPGGLESTTSRYTQSWETTTLAVTAKCNCTCPSGFELNGTTCIKKSKFPDAA